MGKYDCILPWNHVRVWQTGKAWPCCQWVGETPEDMNVNNGDVMNHPLLVETRARMLEDKPVKGCSRCYRLERETGTSMRLDVNTGIFGGIGQDVEKMVPVHKDSEPKLRYLELSISNACNNSCRMCGPELSTHWYKDAKKLGMTDEVEDSKDKGRGRGRNKGKKIPGKKYTKETDPTYEED